MQCLPTGHPRRLGDNEFDHRQPYPGDNGIQFDPQDKDAARLAAVLFGPEAEEDFRGERRIHGDGWPRMN